MNRKVLLLGFAALGLAGCHTDMWRQPRATPLEMSNGLFTDGAMSRPLVPGTIPRDHLREDATYFTGISNGKWTNALPAGLVTSQTGGLKGFLKRGQERFEIYCTPCHGQLGNGNGMIAARGFELRRPVGNYHTDRLRNMPLGHFYDVITNGYGAMYSYASRVEPQDRWAIAAYIRVLQLSQHATTADVDQAAYDRQKAAATTSEGSAEAAHE